MSFFHKKMSQNVWATIMPFGPMTLIFYWPKFFFSGPHFKHCYIGDNGKNSKQNLFSFYKTAKFLNL